jgi:hypothetical protein
LGYIPTASTPSTIAFDQARNQLVVSNNKGIGTDSITVTDAPLGSCWTGSSHIECGI